VGGKGEKGEKTSITPISGRLSAILVQKKKKNLDRDGPASPFSSLCWPRRRREEKKGRKKVRAAGKKGEELIPSAGCSRNRVLEQDVDVEPRGGKREKGAAVTLFEIVSPSPLRTERQKEKESMIRIIEKRLPSTLHREKKRVRGWAR